MLVITGRSRGRRGTSPGGDVDGQQRHATDRKPHDRHGRNVDELGIGPEFVAVVDQLDGGDATAAARATAATTQPAAPASPPRWPTTVSGRRVVDQLGDPYLMKIFSSWGMAQNLTDAEITEALEGVARAGSTRSTSPRTVSASRPSGRSTRTSPVQNFFTGRPFASSLGPAWATMDHIVAEAQRLGITVVFSFFVSYGETGIGPELTAASDANAYDYGIAVASRYRDAPNIVWHVEADTGWQPEDPIGRRLDSIFHGIADTETTHRLIIAEPYLGGTGYQMFISEEGTGNSAYQWLHLSTNAVYDYGDDAVEQFDAVWDEDGATDYPVWDSEPPYASATHYDGDARQQLRERNYATFIRGGSGINYGDEDWWRFGKLGLFDGGLEGPRCRTRRRRSTPSLPGACSTPTSPTRRGHRMTAAFVTGGLGTGDTKAASGYSRSSGLVYKPDSSSITIDLTTFTDAAVHVRWYDPTTGNFTDVGDFPTTGTQVIAHPGSNASGQPDWVLVVDTFTP